MRPTLRALVRLLPIALATASCMAYEPAAQIAVKDPALVALETTRGDRVLARNAARGRVPGTDAEAQRDGDGTIELDGHTVVRRDGRVPGADSLDAMRMASELSVPVCYAARRSGCHHVTIVTPMENVRILREYERPILLVGIMELTVAGTLIFGGVLASRGDEHQTTSGGAILLTSGGVLAVVGLLQTFGGERNARDIVKE